MKEIMKKIKDELLDIKEEQEKLSKLEENSKKLQDEAKKLEEERNQISDTESGFYKDISKQFEEKKKEFSQANIERMSEDRYINALIFSKKRAIVSEIEAKMKYIDENRNISLDGVDTKKLKAEKIALEKEIKLNNTTKEEFEKMSDSDKQAVRKAKENYLNNKHRLDEINPTIKLADALDGKEPKDRFIELEDFLKDVNDIFNRDNIGEIIEIIQNEEYAKALEEAQIRKTEREEQERRNSQMSKEEFARAYNPNYKGHSQNSEQGQNQIDEQEQSKNHVQGQNQENDIKYNMIIDINGNTINVNDNNKLFYKEELRNKDTIREKYGFGSYFINDKKNEKLVDYALISALEKIDDKEGTLVKAYLNVIRDGKTQGDEVKSSIEKLNKAVDIEYKFDKEDGILLNWKEKRIARYAKKMGIASLDGISEKSVWDKISDKAQGILSKIKNTKLLEGKKGQMALESGEEKTEGIQTSDKKASMQSLKIDNKDNRIEKAAQAKETKEEIATQEQIGKDVEKIVEENNENVI